MVFGKFGFFYVCRFCLVLNLFGSESWIGPKVWDQSGQLPARMVNTGLAIRAYQFQAVAASTFSSLEVLAPC